MFIKSPEKHPLYFMITTPAMPVSRIQLFLIVYFLN